MERFRPGRRIRIGHAERQEAVALLTEHYAGRLDITEYDERCASTAAAQTWDELVRLFEDLPEPHPTPSASLAPTTTAPGAGQETRGNEQQKSRDDDISNQEVAGGWSLLSGGPATIVHGVHTGSWWAFGLTLLGGIVILSVSEARKGGRHRKKRDPGRN